MAKSCNINTLVCTYLKTLAPKFLHFANIDETIVHTCHHRWIDFKRTIYCPSYCYS
jgi:hypothetical protein